MTARSGRTASPFRKKLRARRAQLECSPHPSDYPCMKKLWLALIVGSATLVSLAQESETTLKVDVKLVNVFVTVTDARGGPVANLQKENFLIKEDGKEQRIAIFSRESALPLSI